MFTSQEAETRELVRDKYKNSARIRRLALDGGAAAPGSAALAYLKSPERGPPRILIPAPDGA